MTRIKSVLILSLVVVISACSTTRGHRKDADIDVVDANNSAIAAKSSGIGHAANFDGQDLSQTSLVAPHNQLYRFGFDSNVIHSRDLASVRAQARYLASHPKAYVLLAGYTDERGSREYNVGLGERRGKSILDILLAEGVQSNQIKLLSYGQEFPVDPAHTANAWNQNRRVELTYKVVG